MQKICLQIMRNLLAFLLTAGSIFINTETAFAQTKFVRHVRLTEYHTKAQIFASNSMIDMYADRNSHITNVEEAGKNLQIAMAKHYDLKTNMPEKYRSVTKPHHDAIDRYHLEAIGHYEALKAEAGKRNFSEKKLKEHAKNMYSCIEKAEMEHQIIKFKTS